jgi:hypothetical protein
VIEEVEELAEKVVALASDIAEAANIMTGGDALVEVIVSGTGTEEGVGSGDGALASSNGQANHDSHGAGNSHQKGAEPQLMFFNVEATKRDPNPKPRPTLRVTPDL